MSSQKILLLLLTFFLVKVDMAQVCTAEGQKPTTAINVCGNVTIVQANPYVCVNREIFVPGCTGKTIQGVPQIFHDTIPFWYKFTCSQSGTLAFQVTPDTPDDDYNWQLFDYTGYSPGSVYTNHSLVVTGNWSGTLGSTGASATGSPFLICYSDPATNTNSFSQMPTLISGHNYLLLISHRFGQGGYTLSFGGGTADITDPLMPHMVSARATCSGSPLVITFNKKLKCTHPFIDVSEFAINPPLANVVGGVGIDCNHSEEIDSAVLTLDNPLPAGNYTIFIKDPSTISDFCGRYIPVGESIPFVVYPVIPVVMDSLTRPGCTPDELELVFKKNIMCSSIAADGTDFVVTGPSAVTVTGDSVICFNNPFLNAVVTVIKLKLSAPILVKGNYHLKLVTGSDGNTLKDECNQSIPAGSTLDFSIEEPVNADFGYTIRPGCKYDTIDYSHDGLHDANLWKWDFENIGQSNLQNPEIFYDPFGLQHTQLIVSNGGCSDTSDVVPIFLGDEFKAGFEATSLVCPGQPASFKDTSIGHIVSWLWNFGNGNTSTLRSPASQSYIPSQVSTTVIAQLSVTNNKGCTSTATQKISLPNFCYVSVPGAFTPNNDGINDYLYPLNLYNPVGFVFKVFNRYGQVVFETEDPAKRWNGRYRGQVADPGTYMWILHYTDFNTRQFIEQKGTSILIR